MQKKNNIALSFRGLFLLFAVIPVIAGFGYALLYSFGLIGRLGNGFTPEHWDKALFHSEFWTSLLFSFYISGITMVISIAFALTIVIKWLGDLQKGALSYIMYLPLAFPGTVMAFYTFQLLAKSGFASRVALKLGLINSLQGFPDVINDAYGIGIIFSLVLLITPFFIILYTNLYQNERLSELKNLASTIGATPKQITRRVIVPVLLKKSLFTIVIFIIFVMGTYEIPLLLGRQSPSMLSVHIINKLQRYNLNDIPQAYAFSVLYVLIIASVIAIIYIRKPSFIKQDSV